MKRLLAWYLHISLVTRIFVGFILGSIVGAVLWIMTDEATVLRLVPFFSPFGTILINMLKMIVIPVIFLSLIVGASSLPLKKFGRIGGKVITWYLLTSLLAAIVGAILALLLNPGGGADLQGWEKLATALGSQTQELSQAAPTSKGFVAMLVNMFQNPFQALAAGNFLSIIVFAILFGLAIRVSIEGTENSTAISIMEQMIALFTAARDVMFKLVDWILEYSPIGVFALSLINFSMYGPNIVGPYIKVTLGIVAGIFLMVFVVYSLLIFVVTRRSPYRVLKSIQEAMITAFITRSSAATLPVSMRVATDDLKIRNELVSFALPLGATINMDGVCVHLPMFAILAANMFGIELTTGSLVLLILTTVLASIGAGGVPGGSLMLLFLILESLGLDSTQVAVIVALALGINPILDMFETANNVTGDLICTLTVADTEKMIDNNQTGNLQTN
ncbi:MAG TPA: dicarboxylate/amino acid:cation symporter [bacterium]|nr:dicarboxylate/amino acid:cation symporter [bacterium]HNT66507.1 dicarboxylate/amino acid:cation symporter [bacterium]